MGDSHAPEWDGNGVCVVCLKCQDVACCGHHEGTCSRCNGTRKIYDYHRNRVVVCPECVDLADCGGEGDECYVHGAMCAKEKRDHPR